MPSDIFAICSAIYATAFLFISDIYKTNENNKSSITPILKLFSIINISVLSAISIIITTNGIIAFIPLIIFSIAFLKSLLFIQTKV